MIRITLFKQPLYSRAIHTAPVPAKLYHEAPQLNLPVTQFLAILPMPLRN